MTTCTSRWSRCALSRLAAAVTQLGGHPIVMGTGIVALDLSSAGHALPSHALLAIAGVVWFVLLAGGETGMRSPWCLFAIAGAVWLTNAPRPTGRAHGGRAFLGVVAKQSLAVLLTRLSSSPAVRVAALLLLLGGRARYLEALVGFDWGAGG